MKVMNPFLFFMIAISLSGCFGPTLLTKDGKNDPLRDLLFQANPTPSKYEGFNIASVNGLSIPWGTSFILSAGKNALSGKFDTGPYGVTQVTVDQQYTCLLDVKPGKRYRAAGEFIKRKLLSFYVIDEEGNKEANCTPAPQRISNQSIVYISDYDRSPSIVRYRPEDGYKGPIIGISTFKNAFRYTFVDVKFSDGYSEELIFSTDFKPFREGTTPITQIGNGGLYTLEYSSNTTVNGRFCFYPQDSYSKEPFSPTMIIHKSAKPSMEINLIPISN